MMRVLLVDDHASFREPLAFMLDREPDIVVTEQAGSIAEAQTKLHDIDIGIIDLYLGDGKGTVLVRDLRRASPGSAILMLTGTYAREEIADAVEAGADAVLHKSSRIADIISAVRRLCDGERLLSPDETITLLRMAADNRARDSQVQVALNRLTRREREVLQALADGLNDKQIAQRLSVGHETVRTHMVNILGKLGVASRLQALLLAVRYGVITLDIRSSGGSASAVRA